jgi:hypothetical protein
MSFTTKLRALRAVQNRFDADARETQRGLLGVIASMPLPASAALADYHDSLLFLAAHPGDADLERRVAREFTRIERAMKRHRAHVPAPCEDRGMPWVPIVVRFSHDALRWLASHAHAKLELESLEAGTADLGQLLALTLPALERAETTAGRTTDELLDALRVPRRDALAMVLREFARFDDQPQLKDHLFGQLELFVRIVPTDRRFSKAYNRLPALAPTLTSFAAPRGGLPASGRPSGRPTTWHQRDHAKRFDVKALLEVPLPPPRKLDAAALDAAIDVLRNTMALTIRETDPATYLDRGSLRIHDLDRGLSCATFGMTPARQLPLESYVGFTLFKNGLPVAYGGSWVFGTRAAFGMNIFEPFRGGESGLMMAQVLRCYRQRFGVTYFQVDAHQFGLDNPDGIKSGAYWFYYRHGFRSIDPRVARMVRAEKARLDAKPGARSNERTLLAFTESDVALDLDGDGRAPPPRPEHFITKVTRWIARRHRGDRAAAERDAIDVLNKATAVKLRDADMRRAALEWGPVAAACGVDDAQTWQLIAQALRAKPRDVDAYQRVLLRLVPRVTQAAR